MPSFRPDPNILKKHPNAITQQQIEERSRFVGTLLGAAAGEALGAPHEFKSASELRLVPREITGGGIWAAGEPTDDIELTLALLRSIAARTSSETAPPAEAARSTASSLSPRTRCAMAVVTATQEPAQRGS